METAIKEKIAVVKEVLKVEAKELRTLKVEIKEKQRSGRYAGNEQCALQTKRHKWRHKFIAYCQLKGRTLEEIEGKGSNPDKNLVEWYRREICGDFNA